ncbi:BTB domain-containing protein [Phanerochaete sordida]|uniref:BTB domain-containing protein n=1 Tax=Phanerochaete sordida TaxID=48140 RepID=A0A9P3GHT9_9APHY|nr:BTB domain-containing protein [Phanerochaete sordida]
MKASRHTANSEARRPSHHQSLYFKDGDLVISASGKSGKTLLYRVHTAILAQFSPIFRDMLLLPTETSDIEKYDGVPIVYLPDDQNDVSEFLQALYNPSYPKFDPCDPDYPLTAEPILKLATKYEVVSMTEHIFDQIKSQWPATLSDYINMELSLASRRSCQTALENPPFPSIYFSCPEPAAAISVVSKYDTSKIPLAAFYTLSTTGQKYSWSKAKELGQCPQNRPARWELLDDANLVRYFKGKYAVSELHSTLEAVIARNARPPSECTPGYHAARAKFNMSLEWEDRQMIKPCAENISSASEKIVKRRICDGSEAVSVVHNANLIMKTYELLDDMPNWELCPSCRSSTRSALQDMMKSTWDSLPMLFGLEKASTRSNPS